MTADENLNEAYTPPEQSSIQKFYSNRNVFVTGGTGFIGKILIEKLLRSCPDLASVYVLVRNKKGKNLHNRLDEMFEDIIFDRLRKECPKFRHKIVGVGGDCSLPDLGLSLQDRQVLINEISVVFHVAATVKFDEKLKLAMAINVRSPHDIINLSRNMKHLKALIHVSTAYSHVPNVVIEEKLYNSPVDSKKLMLLIDGIPDRILDNITPAILDKWPNTYTYTKAIAEDVVRQEAQNLPVAVFRPSIVLSTYQEPLVAWINNLYGPTGIAAGAGTGVLHTLHCNAKVNANVVPVDMCVNALIATAWEVAEDFEKQHRKTTDDFQNSAPEIPVYHFESSTDNPISWGEFMTKSELYGMENPSVKSIWFYSLALHSNYALYFLHMLLVHFLPALVVDIVLLCCGKSPRMIKLYKKIHKFCSVISYFATRNWTFKSNRIRNLLQKMDDRDRELFFCDLNKLDWNVFFKNYLIGIRIYLLQDPIETLPEAKIKWKRLYWCHQLVKVVTAFVLIRVLISCVSVVYSF